MRLPVELFQVIQLYSSEKEYYALLTIEKSTFYSYAFKTRRILLNKQNTRKFFQDKVYQDNILKKKINNPFYQLRLTYSDPLDFLSAPSPSCGEIVFQNLLVIEDENEFPSSPFSSLFSKRRLVTWNQVQLQSCGDLEDISSGQVRELFVQSCERFLNCLKNFITDKYLSFGTPFPSRLNWQRSQTVEDRHQHANSNEEVTNFPSLPSFLLFMLNRFLL